MCLGASCVDKRRKNHVAFYNTIILLYMYNTQYKLNGPINPTIQTTISSTYHSLEHSFSMVRFEIEKLNAHIHIPENQKD